MDLALRAWVYLRGARGEEENKKVHWFNVEYAEKYIEEQAKNLLKETIKEARRKSNWLKDSC